MLPLPPPLYDFSGDEWHYVITDDQFPTTEAGQLWFASCASSTELWVPMLEKAYAKLHGSYDSLICTWCGCTDCIYRVYMLCQSDFTESQRVGMDWGSTLIFSLVCIPDLLAHSWLHRCGAARHDWDTNTNVPAAQPSDARGRSPSMRYVCNTHTDLCCDTVVQLLGSVAPDCSKRWMQTETTRPMSQRTKLPPKPPSGATHSMYPQQKQHRMLPWGALCM